MKNEDRWFEKFIEAGLLERQADTVVVETELSEKWLGFVNKYTEKDDNEQLSSEERKSLEDFVQDGCGGEAGDLLLKACNGDVVKALAIIKEFPSRRSAKGLLQGVEYFFAD